MLYDLYLLMHWLCGRLIFYKLSIKQYFIRDLHLGHTLKDLPSHLHKSLNTRLQLEVKYLKFHFCGYPPIHYLEFPWSTLYYPPGISNAILRYFSSCASIESDNYNGVVTRCGSNDDYTSENFHVVDTAAHQIDVVAYNRIDDHRPSS